MQNVNDKNMSLKESKTCTADIWEGLEGRNGRVKYNYINYYYLCICMCMPVSVQT